MLAIETTTVENRKSELQPLQKSAFRQAERHLAVVR